MPDETPQEEFERFKKELGKQYMDGLISDAEYDEMLRAKEEELGLNQPVIAGESEGLECPSCGALITEYDTECNICGIALEPVMPSTPTDEADTGAMDAPPIPADELDLGGPDDAPGTCPGCGAEVSGDSTICSMCGYVLGGNEPEMDESIPETPDVESEAQVQPDEDRTCPSCGAIVDKDATECIICETPLDILEVPEPEAQPDDIETSLPAEEVPAEPEPEEELVCAGCGAMLEKGAEKCFICGDVVDSDADAVPEPVAPVEGIEEPEAAEELVCAGCGAVLDEGAEECFICGVVVSSDTDAVPEPEAPAEDMLPVEEMPVDENQIDEPMTIGDEMSDIEDELPPVESVSDDEIPLEEEPGGPEELEVPEEAPEQEIVQEIILMEGEMICPSCSSVIPEGSDKCPECWTDFSLYVKCPSCSLLTPSGEETCRECSASLELLVAEGEPEIPEAGYVPGGIELAPMDIELPEEMEITEELMEEMTELELQEEQGKECLVCGAIFGPEDEACPICFMEYGVEIDEPEIAEFEEWQPMEVAAAPTAYICPNCGENITGLEASEREINEGRWFYRGIISIFIGIFFTSFSIWARGVSAENASLGMNPPPTDVVLNIVGWILVLMGFVFWFFSWKLHEEKVECQHCGIEVDPDMANCINCGSDLTDGEQYVEEYEEDYTEEYPEEEPLAVEDEEYAEDYADEYSDESLEVPAEFDQPLEESEIPEDSEEYQEDESLAAEVDQPAPELPADDVEKAPIEDFIEEPVMEETPEPEPEGPGAGLPTEHEEHKQCPGCGIYVDMDDAICPVCDTVLDDSPALDDADAPTISDAEIEVPSEDEELAGLEPETEAPAPAEPVDEITIPEDGADHTECPSCGADLDAGTKVCPVCEYPLE